MSKKFEVCTETTPKPEKEMTVTETEKLTRDLKIKEQEFRQARTNEQRLQSTITKLKVELENAKYDVIKVASAYKALSDFQKSLEPKKPIKPKK